MPKVEDVPVASAGALQDAPGIVGERLPRSEERHGVEIPLHGAVRADPLPRDVERHAPVHADGIATRPAHRAEQLAGSDAEVNGRHPECRQAVEEGSHDRLHAGDVVVDGDGSDPAVEDLHGLDTGLDLPAQVRNGEITKPLEERPPGVRVGSHERARSVVRARGAAVDEICGQREWRAGKADERDVELLAQEAHRLEDVRNLRLRFEPTQSRDVRARSKRLGDDGSSPGLDSDVDTERLDRHHDVGEQDRGVEFESAQRLHRDLDGEIRVPDGLENVVVPTQLSVFGEVPAGLPHEPHRRAVDRLPPARAQEPIVHGGRHHHAQHTNRHAKRPSSYDPGVDHRRALDDLVAWASSNDNIRLLVLTGSLARNPEESDPLSDVDVELYVRQPATLLESRYWYSTFGDVLAVEELENEGWHPTRLVYYVDGKIDFMIAPVNALDQGVSYVRGFRVLIDKDGLGARLSGDAASATPPTAEEFRRCVDWFAAAAIMTAKAVVRDEPWMAKRRDEDLKEELLRMTEWDHRSRHGWGFDTWHLGVHMRTWMDADVQASLERCWGRFALGETAAALEASIRLFERLGRRTANALGVGGFDLRPVRTEVDRILLLPRQLPRHSPGPP